MRREFFTVTELTRLIKTSLEPNFRNIYVQGEISNLRETTYGSHLYFTLKDENALIKAVIFGYIRRYIRFEIKEGMKVQVLANLSVYEKRGEYQLIVQSLEPLGIGALKIAYEQLKQKLEKEGLFDARHKKPIPLLPRRVGVITSITGAAIRDIISVLRRRFHNVEIVIRPVKVQGEGAAEDIARAIEEFNQYGKVDVLIVGRGGGSFEDLFPFSEEIVARAIFASKIPIISAVGHERDFSISDFVADLRAATPSAAAELVVKNKMELENHINRLFESIRGSVESLIQWHRHLIEKYAERFLVYMPENFFQRYRLVIADTSQSIHDLIQSIVKRKKERLHELHLIMINQSPTARLQRLRNTLNRIAPSIVHTMYERLKERQHKVTLLIKMLNAYSPLKTLERGYSITKTMDGKIIKNASEVSIGDQIVTLLLKGKLISTVTENKN